MSYLVRNKKTNRARQALARANGLPPSVGPRLSSERQVNTHVSDIGRLTVAIREETPLQDVSSLVLATLDGYSE